jgi:hypothetical protein
MLIHKKTIILYFIKYIYVCKEGHREMVSIFNSKKRKPSKKVQGCEGSFLINLESNRKLGIDST